MAIDILHRIIRSLHNTFIGSRCPIWPDFEAQIERTPSGSLRVISQRAGGQYEITTEDTDLLERLDERARANLTTWIVNERLAGAPWPEITQDVISGAIATSRLTMEERADRLLRLLVNRIQRSNSSPRSRFTLQPRTRISETNSVYPTQVGPETHLALAWTESIAFDEIRTMIDYLERREWLKGEFGRIRNEYGGSTRSAIFHCRVTVEGYRRLESLVPNADSSQAFVAMWIDNSVEAVFEKGIKPAINAAGYSAYRVDKEPGVDKIDDAVNEAIRNSRFLVADVTHGKKGHRGSVYYEIGIAHGIGIPVIFTCREDVLTKNELPFDTRQHKHISWQTGRENELIDDLRSAIIERIGPSKLP